MATITEDYVSLETAKLLREKGFNEKTLAYYECDILCHGEWFEWNNSPMGQISAPTLQMTMKWLREIHLWNIHAEQKCFDSGNRLHSKPYLLWCPYIQDVKQPPEKWDFGMSNRKDIIPDDFYYKGYKMAFDTYEEACEEAIKYCLDNLI